MPTPPSCTPSCRGCLPAFFPQSFPLSLPPSPPLFYTTAGVNFKIVLQEYMQCIYTGYGQRAGFLCVSLLCVCPLCGLKCVPHSSLPLELVLILQDSSTPSSPWNVTSLVAFLSMFQSWEPDSLFLQTPKSPAQCPLVVDGLIGFQPRIL